MAKAEVTQIKPGHAAALKDVARKVSRTRAPENETAADRFKRVANTRATVVLDGLRLIGQIGTSKEYEYTFEQVTILLGAINAALVDATDKLRNRAAEGTKVNLFG